MFRDKTSEPFFDEKHFLTDKLGFCIKVTLPEELLGHVDKMFTFYMLTNILYDVKKNNKKYLSTYINYINDLTCK